MDLVIAVGLLALIATLAGSWLWRRRHARQAERWPTAEATVESGAIGVVARDKFTSVQLPVFAFSYRVESGYFSGRFALLPYITDPGESVVARMIGRKFQVRYNPKKPEMWFIPDELIEEGCRVEQNLSPHFVNLKPVN